MTGKPRDARRLLSCACALLLLLASAPAAHSKAWRGIVPLRSKRADVKRRLGRPNPRSNHYELKNERAYVFYADGTPCAKAPEGAWNVPRDTVVSIRVTPKKRILFPALKLDPEKFRREKDKEVATRARYVNEEEGVAYEVFEGGGEDDGLVLHVEYGPAARDERLRCPAPAARPN